MPPSAGRPAAGFLPPAATRPRSFGWLLSLTLRRGGGRRAMSAIVVMLFVAATGLFAAPAITDALSWWHQRQLRSEFGNPHLKTLYRSGHIPVGNDLTELEVDNPRVHIDVIVVQGTTTAALQAGAGHYTETPLPCYQGNVGIAGHRTTYGRPFNKIDQMRPGDTIKLVTPIGSCTYRVVPGRQVLPASEGTSNPWIVAPNDFTVVSQRGALGSGHWLTLTSCNPPGSATTRIVLRAKLVASTVHEPASAYRSRR